MRNLSKAFTLLLIFILFTNCEKESTIKYNETLSNNDVKINAVIKRGDQIPSKILDFVKVKTDLTMLVSINKESIKLLDDKKALSKSNGDNHFGVIDYNKSVIVNNENNTKYTFNVLNTGNLNEVVNLVIVHLEDDSYVEYFIKYTFNDIKTAPRLPSNAIDMSNFSGEVEYFESSGNQIGDYKINSGEVSAKSGNTEPCPNDTVDDPSGDGSSGSGDSTEDEPSGDGPSGEGGGGGNDTGINIGYVGNCGLIYTYLQCDCGGNADGHEPSTCPSCEGSPMVVTNTCNGESWSSNDNKSTKKVIIPCGGDTGAIFDELYNDFLSSLNFDQVSYLSQYPKFQLAIKKQLEVNNFSQQIKDVVKEITLHQIDIFAIEQDYKARMSTSELQIFEGMTQAQQWFYLTNAYKAQNKAQDLYPGIQRNTKADAFRHAYFHALNTTTIGGALSKLLGDAHEDMPNPVAFEVEMDLFNNLEGRRIAVNAIVSGNDYDLAALVRTAVFNGSLSYLSPLNSNGTIIPNVTILVKTNQ
jgi:hypothetical protein